VNSANLWGSSIVFETQSVCKLRDIVAFICTGLVRILRSKSVVSEILCLSLCCIAYILCTYFNVAIYEGRKKHKIWRSALENKKNVTHLEPKLSLNYSTLPASPLLGFRPSSLQLTSEASNDDSLEDGTKDYEICSAVLYLPLSRLQQPVPLPHPLFTANSITVILFTTTFRSLNPPPTDSELCYTHCC